MNHSNRLHPTVALYNMVPNAVWSVILLTPITIYFFSCVDLHYLYLFLALSSPPVFFTRTLIDRLQLGKTAATYRKLGVLRINKVAQNGALINRLIRKRFPEYRGVTHSPSSISRLISQTYMFEKFHQMLFLFYSYTLAYSLLHRHFYWACLIALTNVLYNIYPNLLQQYIRLKLTLLKNRI